MLTSFLQFRCDITLTPQRVRLDLIIRGKDRKGARTGVMVVNESDGALGPVADHAGGLVVLVTQPPVLAVLHCLLHHNQQQFADLLLFDVVPAFSDMSEIMFQGGCLVSHALSLRTDLQPGDYHLPHQKCSSVMQPLIRESVTCNFLSS